MDGLSLLLALQTVDDSMLEHQTSEACCSFGLFSGQHFIAELAAVSLLRALQAGGSMLGSSHCTTVSVTDPEVPFAVASL